MGLEVSSEFSLVAVVAVAAFVAHLFMMTGVVKARKKRVLSLVRFQCEHEEILTLIQAYFKYGVHYPTMYALESENKEAKIFNCVQRGHQNFLEIVPFFLTLLLLSGLQDCDSSGFLFLASRIIYFIDYSSGDPKKRMRGATGGYLCMMVLMGCGISFTVHEIFL